MTSYGPKVKWACGNYVKYGVKVCAGPIILGKDLDNLFKIMFQSLLNYQEVSNELYNYYMIEDTEIHKRKEKQKIGNKIAMLERKKEKLLEIKLKDLIDDGKNFNKRI